jgi:HSP20 family protein
VDRQRPERGQIRRFHTDVDRMFLELVGPERLFGRAQTAFRPNVDVYFSKADKAMIVKLELAGIDPATIHLEAENHTLHVRGHRIEMCPQDKVYQQMEISYGAFARRVHLPVDVDASKATASYEAGFLEIFLPILEQPEMKRIPITIKDDVKDEAQTAEADGSSPAGGAQGGVERP